MFDKSELDNLDLRSSKATFKGRYDNGLEQLRSGYRGLYSTVYSGLAFRPRHDDEGLSIQIHRAPKTAGDNGFQFWLNSVLPGVDRMDIFRAYAQAIIFDTITESEFNNKVSSECHTLVCVPPLPLGTDGFVGALAITHPDDPLMLTLFAEYANEYICFQWESLA